MYHEVYESFLKLEAGNYSVEVGSDIAILVRIYGASLESVHRIEPGERFTCNVWNCFESQCIYEYDADGGFVLDKWNPLHLIVDTYSHSREVYEVVIGSVSYDELTCTLEDMLTCTSSDRGDVCDQSIVPPASSAEYNVNFADDVAVASFDEPENYLTATTFQFISSVCKELESTISGLE